MAGSAYTYGYATLGELIAWIIGWDLILEYAVGAITVSIGWSGYVVSFLHDFGINIPPALSAARGTELIEIPAALAPLVNAKVGWVVSSASLLDQIKAAGTDPTGLVHVTTILNLPAVFIIFVVTTLLVVGIKESANFNNFIVVVKVAVVLLFIVGAAHAISTANWYPFIPPNTGQSGHFGWSGVMTGAGIVFFAYIGFDAVSTAAQEAKNPQRDMPIAIIGSLLICTVLYILVSGNRHWRRAVWSARRPRPDRGDRGPCGHEMDGNADKARCDRRFVVGHSRAVAWTVARVLQHGARRLATTVREPSAPALPHAMDNLDCYWRWRSDLFRRLQRARCGEPLFHRHAACVCNRLSGNSRAACARAKSAAQIQNAMGLVCRSRRRTLGPRPDGFASMANMATLADLVCHRHCDLLRLRRPPQQPRPAADNPPHGTSNS